MTSQVPQYATIESDQELNYLVAINSNKEYNCHYLREDRVAVMRECSDDGTLLNLKKKKEGSNPWVLILIKEFIDSGRTFEAPICQKCSPLMGNLCKEQKFETITSQICTHGRILTNIVRDYSNPYRLDNWLSISEEMINGSKIEIIHKKIDTSCSSQHLALAFEKNKVGILWTQGRMLTPSCTLCSSIKCKHYHQWNAKMKAIRDVKNVDEDKAPIPGRGFNSNWKT